MSQDKKNEQDLVFYAQPNCPKPVSRRQFMAQTLGTAASYVAFPSVLSLLTREAHAATCAVSAPVVDMSDRLVYLVFDWRGGPSPNAALLPGTVLNDKESFAQVRNLAKRGISVGEVGNNVTRAFGGSMWTNHPLTQQLRANVSPAAQLSTDFFILNVRTENDYGNNDGDRRGNQISPANMLAQIADPGRIFKGVGSSAGLSGGNQPSPTNTRKGDFSFVRIRNPDDVANAVQAGMSVSNLGRNKAGQVWDSLKRMSDSQIEYLNGRPVGEDTKSILECMNVGGKSQSLDFDANSPTVFPSASTDPDLGIFNMNNDLESQTATMVHLLANGNASGGVVEIGGGDYHNQNRNTVEGFDTRFGAVLAKSIEYFYRKNIKAFIVTIQDGGIVCNGNNLNANTGRKAPAGDDALGGIASVWLVNGRQAVVNANAPAQRTTGASLVIPGASRQVGMVSANADVVTGAVGGLGGNPSMAAQAIVANYLVASGRSLPSYQRFLSLLGNDPTRIGTDIIKVAKMI